MPNLVSMDVQEQLIRMANDILNMLWFSERCNDITDEGKQNAIKA